MLTNPAPLRSTAEWLFFDSIQPIPHVYGKTNIAPLKYSSDGLDWVVAGHSIDGVDAVIVDDASISEYQHTNGVDNTGAQVAFIRLRKTPESDIIVKCRGKIDPVLGGLMTNPGRIIWDILANIGGITITLSQLDRFIIDTQGIEFSGVVDSNTVTLRSIIDDLQRSAGSAVSLGMPGIAVLYPQLSMPTATYLWGNFAELDITPPSSVSTVDNIATVMRVNYGLDSSIGEYGGSVQYKCDSAIEKYGRIEREVDASWLVTARDAASLCQRLLKYYARPIYSTTFNTSKINNIPSSGYITLNHPHSPLSGNVFVKNSEIDLVNQETTITVESAYGTEPSVSLEYTSTRFEETQSDLFISFRDGVATFTIKDSSGLPINQARVTISNQTKVSDANGKVEFLLAPGTYEITISASGYTTQTITHEFINVSVS